MLLIRPLPEFTAWIDGLKDETVRGVVVARIKRLELGLMGDVALVGDGVSGGADTPWRGMAAVLHAARSDDHRAAGWRLEAHTEDRHEAREGIGRALLD